MNLTVPMVRPNTFVIGLFAVGGLLAAWYLYDRFVNEEVTR